MRHDEEGAGHRHLRVQGLILEELRALLAGAGAPNYVAVLGFLASSDRVDEAVAELRGVIRSAIRTAVTFGSERVVFREWSDENAPPTEPVRPTPRPQS